MRQGFVVSHDQTPIYYEVSGQPRGAPTMVFCDGAGCSGYIWKYIKSSLEGHYRLVHFHYRGHGKTPSPIDIKSISIPQLADDLSLVLDACETPSATVFGHSMGVQVALECYRRHPAKVHGLVLVCGTHSYPLRTFRGKDTLEKLMPWAQLLVRTLPRASNLLWSQLVPSMLAYRLASRIEVNGRLIRMEDFSPYFDGISKIDVRLLLATLQAAGNHDASDLLASIRVPALIVAGKRDSFTPFHLSEEMHRNIPQAELMVVTQGSHTTPIEHPVEVSSGIVQFLQKHAATTKKRRSK